MRDDRRTADDLPPVVELINGADVRPESITWLWEGWLARGKLHIMAGPPGTGKTTVLLKMIALITSGRPFPDGSPTIPGHVVIWSGEDGIADTLVPRLIAAGANMRRVHFVKRLQDGRGSRPFDPSTDMDALQAKISQVGDVALLMLDSVVSAVGGDSHKNTEVRRGLQPLVDLSEAVNCAAVGVSHFTKATAGRDPIERVTGSIAFGALPRIVIAIARRKEGDGPQGDTRLMVRAKSNIGPDGGGFEFRMTLVAGIVDDQVPVAEFGDRLQGPAKKLLDDAETEEDAATAERRSAADFLRELLAGGPLTPKEVRHHGDEAGYSWRTLQRAMRLAAVQHRRGGAPGTPGKWWIGTPQRATAPPRHVREFGATGGAADRRRRDPDKVYPNWKRRTNGQNPSPLDTEGEP